MWKRIDDMITNNPFKVFVVAILFFVIIATHIPKYNDTNYVKENQEKRDEEQKLRQTERDKELKERIRQEKEEEFKRKDAEETQAFIKSKEKIKIYSSISDSDSMRWATIKAKNGIKHIANDPDSIIDVSPITEIVRIRIKDIPDARYAMKVSYRGKNQYGAVVREEATIIFNRSYTVLSISPKTYF